MFFHTGICIDKSLEIPRQKSPDTFDKLLADLSESSASKTDDAEQSAAEGKAKVVVMFVNEDNCRQLVNATIANHMTEAFYWLASDSWGAKRVPVDKQEWAAEGTVTILPQRQVVEGTSIRLSFIMIACSLYLLVASGATVRTVSSAQIQFGGVLHHDSQR